MAATDTHRAKSLARIRAIQAEIANLDAICSGTLTRRMTTCGNPRCRCARGERHGPYVRWGHMVKGRLVQRWLSAEEAPRFAAANRAFRALKRLLHAWERESLRILEDPDRRKS